MTQIKKSSTIQENKQAAFKECPVTYVMAKIGGYWKPIILYQLLSGSKRYNEIRKAIPAVSEKVLIQHLKQLESDGLLQREAKPVVPPYVTYSLTSSGWALKPVLYTMVVWAMEENGMRAELHYKSVDDFPGQAAENSVV
jgi:DNA-binding HxlR family transcriptional regulator